MYIYFYARLAQLVERTAFNRMVVGSIPTVGIIKVKIFYFTLYLSVLLIKKFEIEKIEKFYLMLLN